MQTYTVDGSSWGKMPWSLRLRAAVACLRSKPVVTMTSWDLARDPEDESQPILEMLPLAPGALMFRNLFQRPIKVNGEVHR
jgi:hypothetical protein